MLQDVADRLKTNIVIELDDLDTVSLDRPSYSRPDKTKYSCSWL
jgi:hypothetical protein